MKMSTDIANYLLKGRKPSRSYLNWNYTDFNKREAGKDCIKKQIN
jgi:hypothetical protein